MNRLRVVVWIATNPEKFGMFNTLWQGCADKIQPNGGDFSVAWNYISRIAPELFSEDLNNRFTLALYCNQLREEKTDDQNT